MTSIVDSLTSLLTSRGAAGNGPDPLAVIRQWTTKTSMAVRRYEEARRGGDEGSAGAALQETIAFFAAIVGLAGHRDFDSLPLIERAIRRLDRHDYLVQQLALFQSERADVVAMKFLEDEDDLTRYGDMRAAAAADSVP